MLFTIEKTSLGVWIPGHGIGKTEGHPSDTQHAERQPPPEAEKQEHGSAIDGIHPPVQNATDEILTPTVRVLGGQQLGHENGILMNRTSASMRETQEHFLILSTPQGQ